MNPTVIHASGMPPGTLEVAAAIVGGGACGLTAATCLQAAGIDTVVVERDAAPRGSTALSSGFIPAAGTAVQRAAGIDDSPQQFAKDIQRKAHDQAAPHLVAAYTQAIAPALDALQDEHGLAFELLDGFLYPGHTARRMHAVPERTGEGLVHRLERAASQAGATVLTQSQVVELWWHEGQAIGIGYRRPDGRIEHLACRALMLACNGYGGNPALVRRWLPEMSDAVFAGHPGNDGSAVLWGEALGAAAGDLGAYQGHGSWAMPHGVLITWAVMTQGGIQVNAAGKRFHDETAGYSEASVGVLSQPGGVAWNILDERLLTLARGFPDFVSAQTMGAVRQARDVPLLAKLIGCDAQVLAATLADTQLQPPYSAIQVTGALFHTQGGLEVDAQCRVQLRSGQTCSNLLAAGGAARGVSGPAVWGYLSGNGLLSAVAGGYLSAQTIQALLA